MACRGQVVTGKHAGSTPGDGERKGGGVGAELQEPLTLLLGKVKKGTKVGCERRPSGRPSEDNCQSAWRGMGKSSSQMEKWALSLVRW